MAQRAEVAVAEVANERAENERTFACLGKQCLQSCAIADRAPILNYYQTIPGSARENRRQLALRLGITANSLAIRACRIRSRLEAVSPCLRRRGDISAKFRSHLSRCLYL